MKIEVHFRDRLLGVGTSNGDRVTWEGDKARQAAGIAAHYERDGYKGDDLLRVMLKKLRGNTWAKEVPS